MNREKAIELVGKYVQSWVNRERNEFLETLHDSATVRECNGPVYEGTASLEGWFRTWHADGGRVLEWTIDSCLYDPDTHSVAFEWDFECLADGDEYAFFGSSHVTFRDGRIRSINEYERTKDQYRPEATVDQF